MKVRLSVSLLAAAACLPAFADPVELDGEMWHAIVIRPVDLWVGDATARENSEAAVKKHQSNYEIVIKGARLRGGPLLFQGPSDNPIVAGVRQELERGGFELSLSQRYMFLVNDNQYLEAAAYKTFATVQMAAYDRLIRAEGDPDNLESRVRGRKILGNVFAVATAGIVKGTFGTNAMAGAIGADIPGSSYQLPLGAQGTMVPALLPAFDASPYETISARRITYFAGMNGQIIIALKKGWTEADEASALTKSVAVALGVGATEETVEASRQANLAHRRSVWTACIAEGPCKPAVKDIPRTDSP